MKKPWGENRWREKGGEKMAKQVAQILNPALAVFVAMSTKFKREKELKTKKN